MKDKIKRAREFWPVIEYSVEGRKLSHARDPHNWRVRNTENHPADPNWETGTYARCHSMFRFNNKLQLNTMIFDLVFVKEMSSHVIRSAFIITKINDGKLKFDEFLFADGDPQTMKLSFPRTSYGIKVNKEEMYETVANMANHGYHRYKAGEKPLSVSDADWKRMKKEANTDRFHKHTCN